MTKKRICMICPAVTGHLNPMTALGRRLKQRGHDVTVIALVDAETRVQRSGLNFLPFGSEAFSPGAVLEMTRRLGELEQRAALEFTVDHYRREAIALLDDFPNLIKGHSFDAVITDQTMPGGSAAEMTGLPFITVCNALAMNPEPTIPPWSTPWMYDGSPAGLARNDQGYRAAAMIVQPVVDAVNRAREHAQLAPLPAPNSRSRGGDSPLAIISQQPAVFDFPRHNLPAHFHYAGPLVDDEPLPAVDFPFERLDGRPLVYASLGTLQNGLQGVFRTVAAAAAKLPVQLVITMGRSDSIPPQDLDGAPIVVPYAPQRPLLQRAALAITHAGLNTVLESLSLGVPLVAIPITNDQPANAARLAWLGAGKVLPLAELTEGDLRAAMDTVLRNPSFRARAEQIQNEIAGSGCARAADIIEAALATNRPVLRKSS